jgi:hypothetical protein
VLSGGLMITGGEEKEEILQGKADELRDIYLGSVASDEEVGLHLIGPERPPHVGDEFTVNVALNNPEGALVDSVNFAVLFDPNYLQVVDTDKFNYILRGVNVHDGPFHQDFPWDMHKKNEVRNDRGLINYKMALSNGASLPSKTFARIHFRAIAPIDQTSIGFVKGRPGAPDMTSVRYFGYERLNLTPDYSYPSVVIPILPPTRDIAEKPREVEDAVVVEPEDVSVRSLKIERN